MTEPFFRIIEIFSCLLFMVFARLELGLRRTRASTHYHFDKGVF